MAAGKPYILNTVKSGRNPRIPACRMLANEGRLSMSAYVGNWLSEAYGLKDKRNNPDYKHWEEDSVEYAAARN